VVSFTPLSLFPQEKKPWYPLDRRLGEPHGHSGRGGEEKKSQPPSHTNSAQTSLELHFYGLKVSYFSVNYSFFSNTQIKVTILSGLVNVWLL